MCAIIFYYFKVCSVIFWCFHFGYFFVAFMCDWFFFSDVPWFFEICFDLGVIFLVFSVALSRCVWISGGMSKFIVFDAIPVSHLPVRSLRSDSRSPEPLRFGTRFWHCISVRLSNPLAVSNILGTEGFSGIGIAWIKDLRFSTPQPLLGYKADNQSSSPDTQIEAFDVKVGWTIQWMWLSRPHRQEDSIVKKVSPHMTLNRFANLCQSFEIQFETSEADWNVNAFGDVSLMFLCRSFACS